MSAYVILIRERSHDPTMLETYAKVGPSLEGVSCKALAAYARHEMHESPAPEGVAIAIHWFGAAAQCDASPA